MNENSNKVVDIISAEENLGLGSVSIAFSGSMNNPGSNSISLQPLLPEAIPNPTFSTHQFPPESQGVQDATISRPPRTRSLRQGCYLIRYSPLLSQPFHRSVHFDGTMRIQHDETNTIASGDLYVHNTLQASPAIVREPRPGSGIPIFPRGGYRYYVRITQILEGTTSGNSFTLGFELFRFNPSTNLWTTEGSFTALMRWTTAPSDYPSSSDYLIGEVKNNSGTTVGNLTIGWVSPYLRRATVEIDRVPESEWPVDDGTTITWRTVFDIVGWDITVIQSNSDLVEPSGESWSNAELHAAMLARRDATNLDTEWRYHIVCARRLNATERGIMYDNGATDSNNIPREAVGISSHWIIPDDDTWGLVRGMRFGTATSPYFRTALHEIGHAMGLYHNTLDFGIMNTTDVISAMATPPIQFPNNIKWSHAPDDQKRLRHFPDIWVRPGGTPFGLTFSTAPISPDDMAITPEGLELQVSPQLETVPLGAPVRINFILVNKTNTPIQVPASLDMKMGHVSGMVINPSEVVRKFSPLVLCVDNEKTILLETGQNLKDSVTLLRGGQGALFPSSGLHRIIVEISWVIDGIPAHIFGETTVMITPPVDEAHSKAARKILSTPDTLLTLALGGDYLDDGIKAIQIGIENPVLKPHFAFVEAKRLGSRFGKRKADLKACSKLLDKTTVMSPSEIRRAAKMIQDAGKEVTSETKKNLKDTLKSKASTIAPDKETEGLVDSL